MAVYGSKRTIYVVTFAVLAVFMIIMIGAFTSQTGQQSNTESYKLADFIENIVGKFYGADHNSMSLRMSINLIIRKTGHFLEFMLLGIPVYAMLTILFLKRQRAAALSVAFCMAVAGLDEFRQIFVNGRNPQIRDILIDTCGAVLGIYLSSIILARVLRKITGNNSESKASD